MGQMYLWLLLSPWLTLSCAVSFLQYPVCKRRLQLPVHGMNHAVDTLHGGCGIEGLTTWLCLFYLSF